MRLYEIPGEQDMLDQCISGSILIYRLSIDAMTPIRKISRFEGPMALRVNLGLSQIDAVCIDIHTAGSLIDFQYRVGRRMAFDGDVFLVGP